MPETVLVTGFPSFVARKMVEELVREPDTTIYCVVRKKTLEEARSVLDVLPLDQRRRILVIEGDAAAMDLGLSGAELAALTPKIDVIHHLAQVSYMGAEAKLATTVNVNGAREIIELASLCPNLKCLVYHSTAQVSGDRKGLVLEDELD